jgi:DMSO/TMAO reductase YedYZ molybdopterin-dependent catalytic subunit
MDAEGLKGKGIRRRIFLKAMGALAFLSLMPTRGWSFFLSQFQTRTVEKENFIFDPNTGMVKWKSRGSEPYQLLVEGLVEKPRQFSYKELRSFPQVQQIGDFHCVEGWSVKDVHWGGFRFQEILKRIKPKPGADYVTFHALGETTDKPQGQKHYIESYPLQELLEPRRECLMALDIDGKPLSHERGAPLRFISPYDLGYKSIKFVSRVEFSQSPRPGWWTLANPIYPIQAPVPSDRLRKKNS